jgi:hypothetical protein
VSEMDEAIYPGEVVAAARARLRRRLVAVLAALAVAGCVVVVMTATPAPVCLAYGPGPVNNGRAVIAAGVALGVPEDGIVAGLTAAMRETGLRNLANPNEPESLSVGHDGLAVDRTSVGILAQTRRWGPVDELMTPATAATKFFTVMHTELAAGSEATLSPARVAGLVQRSAFPDAYGADVSAARQFYRDHIGEVRATRCPAGESFLVEAFS